MTRGRTLIATLMVLGSVGLALSACAASGPGPVYADGYYDYPGYYDPGYVNSFGFGFDGDRDHDRFPHHRDGHDHDGYDHGMHDEYHGTTVAHGFGGEHGFGGGHGGGGGGHGGGGHR